MASTTEACSQTEMEVRPLRDPGWLRLDCAGCDFYVDIETPTLAGLMLAAKHSKKEK